MDSVLSQSDQSHLLPDFDQAELSPLILTVGLFPDVVLVLIFSALLKGVTFARVRHRVHFLGLRLTTENRRRDDSGKYQPPAQFL